MEDTASKLDMSLDALAARGGLTKAPRQARVGSPDDKPYAVDEAEVTNRLYIGNLDYSTSWQDLKDHFKTCGTVVFADVFRDERGRSKGCGIIEFETRAEALQALRTLNHTSIGESEFKIFCREDREDRNRGGGGGGDRGERGDRGGGGAERGGGRGRGAGRGGKGRGGERGAERGGERGGNGNGGGGGSGVVITTKAYREQQLNKEGGGGAAGSVAGRQVFVGNLPFHTSWQDLKDAFKSCGTVVRAEILQAEGKPRGAGTVLFETADGAQRAIRDFNEAQFDGRVITVKLDRKAA